VHFNLGQLWDYLGEEISAQKALERAYGLEPQHPDYLKALTQSHLKYRRLDALDRLADEVLDQDPESGVGRRLRELVQAAKKERR
jgi:hypothetical protein